MGWIANTVRRARMLGGSTLMRAGLALIGGRQPVVDCDEDGQDTGPGHPAVSFGPRAQAMRGPANPSPRPPPPEPKPLAGSAAERLRRARGW